jgi:hypothetical protein
VKFNQNSVTLFQPKPDSVWWDAFQNGEYVLHHHEPLTGSEPGPIGEWANVLKDWIEKVN